MNVSVKGGSYASGLIVALATGQPNINITNCNVNYTIIFDDDSKAESPGVLGMVVEPNITYILNVTTHIYIENTIDPGTGFIGTAVLGDFTIINTTADIRLVGNSNGTGFLGFVE